MRDETVLGLAALNARFYRDQAASFSSTRRAPWPGWRNCLPFFEDVLHAEASWDDSALSGCAAAAFDASEAALGPQGSVLDLGCGNLRFEAFLANALAGVNLRFLAVDACEPLMEDASALPSHATVRTMALDAVAALVGEGRDAAAAASALAQRFGTGAHDASVAFGFLHHVPSRRLRAAALRALVESTRPGGVAAVSLWRFLDDFESARKADEAHNRALGFLADGAGAPCIDPAELEPGDRFLGWQGKRGAYRYCHSFSDDDVEALVSAVGGCASLVARFRADGRTGDANEYLVFRAG